MEKKERGFKIVALCVALVALSVAYAGYTSTLTVEGTATVKSAWDIKWTDLSAGTKTGYADISNKSLAIDSTEQAISGIIGTLKAPGDTITYTWKATNAGEIDATISGVTVGSLSCAPAATATGTRRADARRASRPGRPPAWFPRPAAAPSRPGFRAVEKPAALNPPSAIVPARPPARSGHSRGLSPLPADTRKRR